MTRSANGASNGPRLDHNCIWVSDTEKSAKFLTETMGWKRHPIRIAVSEDDKTIGGMIGTFIDANGLWIELIEPTSAGPGMDILNRVGDGAIVEINFELGDEYKSVIDTLSAKGIEMLSMDGTPLQNGGLIAEGVVKGETIDTLEQTGQRIAYFPPSVSHGPGIEYYERIEADHEGLINVRDQMWRDIVRADGEPRVDHVSILVEDLERTAAFYTDIVGLRRHPRAFDAPASELYGSGVKIAYINANGVFPTDLWIKLIQPTTPGPLKNLLDRHGDGFLLEIGVEVADLSAFQKTMAGRGITLVGFGDQALPQGASSLAVTPDGDQACYFSLSDSFGMRMMLFERGPSAQAGAAARDLDWRG